jgi:hypothetical protein
MQSGAHHLAQGGVVAVVVLAIVGVDLDRQRRGAVLEHEFVLERKSKSLGSARDGAASRR